MSIERVRGKNVAVFVYDSGTWKLGACYRDCELDINTDFIETSVTGTGFWKTVKPRQNSFTGSVSGVIHLAKTGMVSIVNFEQLQFAQQQLLMRFQMTSDKGDIYTKEAAFFISNINQKGPYNDIAPFSISLQGTGVITTITTPTVTNNSNKVKRSNDYVGVGGEAGFTDATLIGKDILEVVKDGIGNAKIITSGTPVAKEVKYTSSTGAFEWAIPFELGEIAYVIYQDI